MYAGLAKGKNQRIKTACNYSRSDYFFLRPKISYIPFSTPINVNEKIMNNTLLSVDQLSMKNMIYRTLQCFKQKFLRKMPWRERLFT